MSVSRHYTNTIQSSVSKLFVIASQVRKKEKEMKTDKNHDKPQLLSKRHTLGTRPPPRRTANKAGTASTGPGATAGRHYPSTGARPCGESQSDIDTPTGRQTTQTFGQLLLTPVCSHSHHAARSAQPDPASTAALRPQTASNARNPNTGRTPLLCLAPHRQPARPIASLDPDTLGNGTCSELVTMNTTPPEILLKLVRKNNSSRFRE